MPFVGTAVCLAYALAHGWWAVSGTPAFVRAESVFVGGWLVALAAALAALICVGIGTGLVFRWSAAGQWAWCGAGWLVSAGLAAYCMLLLPGLSQLLMVPFGEPFSLDDLGALLLRIVGTVGAILTYASTRVMLRRLRTGCPQCGRIHGRSPETRAAHTSRWGYVGAYLAVTGLVIRLIPAIPAWVTDGLGDVPGGKGFLLFIGLLVLAGTVLPLALVHRWGRIWPAWVLPLAGRPVPRWIVLAPGLMISVGLLAYFGVGGGTAMILGKTSGHPLEALEIGAYVLWGCGLAVAAASYARLTRPPCTLRSAAGTSARSWS